MCGGAGRGGQARNATIASTPSIHAEHPRPRPSAAAGAIVVREPYSFEGAPDAWIATLADPDDNYFQLMSPFDPDSMGAG